MREIITQTVVAFVLISLCVELFGWAVQHCFGEAWWQRLLSARDDGSLKSADPMRLQTALSEQLTGEEGIRR